MRVVIDEDIPASLTPRFRVGGHTANHVEDLGLKGKHNGVLLAAISGSADILVTGDTNLGHQQNLKKFDSRSFSCGPHGSSSTRSFR